MDRDAAFEKYTAAVVEVLRVEAEKVVPEAAFNADLDADSLDLAELMMKLEEDFDVEIDESELEGVGTVGEAFDLLFGKLS